MSIDDMALSASTVGEWRAVLHDLVDDVVDRMLLTAEWEREIDVDDGWWAEDDEPWWALDEDEPWWAAEAEEPPGDPPGLAAALNAGLVAEIERGTAFWGCDGTLRCTEVWARQVMDRPDGLLDAYRRAGRRCDCAVLHHALGQDGPVRRCLRGPGRGGPQAPGSVS